MLIHLLSILFVQFKQIFKVSKTIFMQIKGLKTNPSIYKPHHIVNTSALYDDSSITIREVFKYVQVSTLAIDDV